LRSILAHVISDGDNFGELAWGNPKPTLLCIDNQTQPRAPVLPPRQLRVSYITPHLDYLSNTKIGRKHKAHRHQAQQEKPWRKSEKGRSKGKDKDRRGRMGNDESKVVDPSTPPQTLQSRTLESLAQYIKDGRARKIVVMVSLLYTRLRSHIDLELGRRRYQHISRYTRFQITRDGTVCEPRAIEPSLRRSGIRYIVLPQ
jgi:hypothetical protein